MNKPRYILVRGYHSIIDKSLKTEEIECDTLEEAINLGAEDFLDDDEEEYKILTSVADLQTISEGLEQAGFEHTTAEFTRIPENTIEVTDEKTATSLMRLIDKLEEHDDVQNVYSNADIPDDVMEKIEGSY